MPNSVNQPSSIQEMFQPKDASDCEGVWVSRQFIEDLKTALLTRTVHFDPRCFRNEQQADGSLCITCTGVVGAKLCPSFQVKNDENGRWCVSFGEVIIPSGIQPDPPVEVTVEGSAFNNAGDAICINSFNPDTQCMMFCFEFRGGDDLNDIPEGQAISFDVQVFDFANKPADVPGAAAQYDNNDVLESPEENGVIYYPFYDPRLEDPQAVCQNMYLHSCGGRVFQFTPYGG